MFFITVNSNVAFSLSFVKISALLFLGSLGNCWFVAAAASLSQRPKILDKVIPDHSTATIVSDDNDAYQGLFRFRFWRFGEWVEVVVDDRLPTIDNELVYSKSKDRHEFWSALLEKAYAKLAGSYEALRGGNAADALVDFTGGVSESIDLVKKDYANDLEKRKVLHKHLRKLLEKDNTMCSAAIKIQSNDEMEMQLETGLVKGHAYTINTVNTIPIGESFFSRFNAENIYLVKLRNPWGNREWNGAWSDDSEELKQLSEEEKAELGVKIEDDGEFWMPWDDFCTHFTIVTVCALVNTSIFSFDKTYNEGLFKGTWKGRGSGGCVNNKSTFFNNPQYMFDMSGKTKEEVFISLMQPDTRTGKATGKGNLTIGFYVMKVEANRTHRVNYLYDKAGNSTFINSREVFDRLELNPGRYVIIPSTFHPKVDGNFFLRVFTDKSNDMEELVSDKPKARRLACLPFWRHSTTQMTVIVTEVLNLVNKSEISSTVDPYCIIECEGAKITTPTISDSLNPRFDYGGIFYVKNLHEATLKIQVWDSNPVLPDTYLGGIATSVRPNNKLILHTVPLMEKITKDGKGNVQAEGTILFKLAISNNLGFM